MSEKDAREITFTFMHDDGADGDESFVEVLWEAVDRLGGYDQCAVATSATLSAEARCPVPCDQDCAAGSTHCPDIHEPNHKKACQIHREIS